MPLSPPPFSRACCGESPVLPPHRKWQAHSGWAQGGLRPGKRALVPSFPRLYLAARAPPRRPPQGIQYLRAAPETVTCLLHPQQLCQKHQKSSHSVSLPARTVFTFPGLVVLRPPEDGEDRACQGEAPAGLGAWVYLCGYVSVCVGGVMSVFIVHVCGCGFTCVLVRCLVFFYVHVCV